MAVQNRDLSEDTLVSMFAERAAALGVRVDRVPTSDDAVLIITEIATTCGAAKILIGPDMRVAAPALVAAIERAGVRAESPGPPNEVRDAVFGLSLARMAVAETGSVLLSEPDLGDRSISMMARTNLIVCQTDSLVERLDMGAKVLRATADRPGGFATIVTGPSRTADIERVLTVGVQGPAAVVVVFVDDIA